MKAIGLYHYLPIEDPQSLIDLEIETPVPDAHQLLVRVKAIAVNPVDVKTRAQKAQAETIPGLVVMRKNSRVDFRDRMEYK
jgi:NADPH2:quinone reductase